MRSDPLSNTFAALAHPVRRQILAQLAQGEATVSEIAAPFEVSLPAVSRHIKVLERAGLITQGQSAQFRPCRLNPARLREIATWAESYRPVWEARFDRMESFLTGLSEKSDDE